MDKATILNELKKFKDQFTNEIIPYYKLDNEKEGEIHFRRWKDRIIDFVSKFNNKEAEEYQNRPFVGFAFSPIESDFSFFWRTEGEFAFAFVNSLITGIEKDEVTIEPDICTDKQREKDHDNVIRGKIVFNDLINESPEIETLFLDIVKFSELNHSDRLTKLNKLNEIIKKLLNKNKLDENEGVIILPTGDGMALSFLTNKPTLVIDSASEINNACKREQIAIRIGINKSRDTVIYDINENINITGPGIIGAQRIMDFASSYEIHISESVYQSVKDRVSKHYFSSQKRSTDKHNIEWIYYLFKK